jgi:geranylgeranyl pyrophosphate synthase
MTAASAPFEQVLEAAGERVRGSIAGVERVLGKIVESHGEPLGRSARQTLAAGGKRLRPLLVLISGEAGDVDAAQDAVGDGDGALVRAAAATELVHMATLVHDDVVDAADVRRGSPTVFATSGRDAATASGDFLFSRAFALLERNCDQRQVRALSEACLDLARGELVQRHDAYSATIDEARYLYRCGLKTASLFVAACKLGSLAAGAGEHEAGALGRFGHKMGLAFQVLDDVLDVAGPAERTGKHRGTDLLEGTTTLPLILAARSDPALRATDLRTITSRRQAEEVSDRIAATQALEQSRQIAAGLVAEAKLELERELDAEVTELLHLVADGVVSRYS